MRLLVPFGTRPEIVKLAPVVAAMRGRGITVRTVATGQHYDASLATSFYEALGMEPDEQWGADDSRAPEGARVGAMLARALGALESDRPDALVCLGDTYTVPLFCLAARRHGVPVVHLEAGLRSFNETSLEELNRRVAGAAASVHLAPTGLAASNLAREGVAPERIRVVGNPVIDALVRSGVTPRPLGERLGVVLTAHRATNVDDPARLAALVELVESLAAEAGPVSFPLHPRTRSRLEASGLIGRLESSGARLLAPVPYAQMLDLVRSSKVVVTDSGGLQEEASWLGVPVVVLRPSTPRWEGVRDRTTVLAGLDPAVALAAVRTFAEPDEQARVAQTPCPYGDGRTAERVADLLVSGELAPLLQMREPDRAAGWHAAW